MSIGFFIAAILSALIFAVHTFIGTREVRAPLAASPLAPAVASTLLLAWHGCTIALAVVALGFAWAAFDPMAWDVGALMAGFTAVFAVWGLALQRRSGLGFAVLPQWSGFAAVTLAALVSLLGVA